MKVNYNFEVKLLLSLVININKEPINSLFIQLLHCALLLKVYTNNHDKINKTLSTK